MSTPRVVQIAEFDRPHAGSFVPVLDGLLRIAAERGWRTEVVLPEAAGRASWSATLAEHSRLRLAPERALTSRRLRARWLAEQLRDEPGPTVLHTHFTSWDVAALLAARGRGDDAVFWHIHSALPKTPAMAVRGVVKFGLLGRGVAGILCPAPNIALGVKQWLAPRGRVHFVPSALAAEAHPLVGPKQRAAARRELAIPDRARVILHFGWHEYLKATDTFLAAMREIVDRDRSALALVRGHEPASERQAAALGLGDHVRFQPPVDDANTLFAAADVVVSSSREEGMAYTVLEAVAAGTPVVATPIPGHTFIADGVDACRITRRDPLALATTTLAVLDEPAERREREARQAHEWIAENLSIAAIGGRIVDLHAAAIGGLIACAPRPAAPPSPPRVIQVFQFDNPNPGSFVPMVAAASRVAIAAGAEAEIVVGSGSAGFSWIEDLRAAGAAVRFAPDVGRDGMRRWLRDLIDESTAPAILHSHFTRYDIAAAAAAASIPRAKVIWHVHSALNRDAVVYARNVVKFGLFGRRVDRVICPSPDLAEDLRRRRASSRIIEFIPNGIDPARFGPATGSRRAAAREQLGLSEAGRVILGFAWNWEVKGGELFIRTVAAVRSELPEVEAVLITADPRGAGLAKQLGIDGAVRLLPAVFDPTELFAAADLMVAASVREGGTPLAALEALASGLRVVGSDIGAHRFIADRSEAMTIARREPAEMAAAVVDALRRPSAPAAELPAEFTLARWGERIGAVYSELIASSSRI